MIALRTPILTCASLVLLAAAGCQKESASAALPPAGLAGAPGAAPQGPSIHLTPSGLPALPPGHPGVQGVQGVPPALGTAGGPHAGAQPGAGQPALPPGHPTPSAGHVSPGLDGSLLPGSGTKPELEGTVLEAQNVKEYTYLRVKRDDGTEAWTAIMQTPIQPGQRVKIAKELWMSDFQSPSLGRTFDQILFGRLMQ